MPLEVCWKTGSDFRKQGPICLFCGWCPTPVGTGTLSWRRPDTHGCPGDRKTQAASRSHAAKRERCSFQRGNALMEKWLCGAHIAPTHKDAVDGCQLLQTTLIPPGWGQLDEMPHQTHEPSQSQRFPSQFVTPALLPRMLYRIWFSQLLQNVQKWPWKPP